MSDSEPFLSRWSRRKREAEADAAPPTASAEPVATRDDDAQAPDTVRATSSPAPASGASVEPSQDQNLEDLLAKLPKIEDLTSQHDLVAFMQRGVPDALRNAALRKMWSVDPAIRDFVGFYAEYAWDWNTPGGVPGSGPLTESDDVQATLRQLFGDSPQDAAERLLEREAEAGAPRDQTPQATNRDDDDVRAAAQHAGDNSIASDGAAQDQAANTRTPQDIDALRSDSEARPAAELSPPRRKHGGAIPT